MSRPYGIKKDFKRKASWGGKKREPEVTTVISAGQKTPLLKKISLVLIGTKFALNKNKNRGKDFYEKDLIQLFRFSLLMGDDFLHFLHG